MHVKAKNRRLLATVCVTAFLIPAAFTLYVTAGQWERLAEWSTNPVFIGAAVVTAVLVAGVVWWKGAASVPEVILVQAAALLFCQSAGVFQYVTGAEAVEKKPPTLSIRSPYDGTEVRCNGVLLGTTPLTITLDDFSERVSPADEPPVQEAAFTLYGSNTDSLANVHWSAIPVDPFDPDSSRMGKTTEVILKRFAASRYFWTFRFGEYQAAMSNVHFYRSNEELILTVNGWETLKRHARTLKVLAKEESVDPLVAYGDHIDAHPPLRQELTPPVRHETPSAARYSHELERFSKEPLGFQDAVMKRDWRWIARSNDPRSVPLLKLFLERSRQNHHDDRSLLTFREHVLLILMDSEQPEVRKIVRNILSSADWTHADVLTYYIDEQLKSGADREELTSWLATRRDDLSNHFLPLMLRIAGSNFAEEAGPFSEHEWSMYLQNSPEVPEVVMEWLAMQWRESPSGRLTMGLARLPMHPIAYAAVAESELSSATNVRDFIQIMNSSSRSDWMKDALSEAAAGALKTASDDSHVAELAKFLQRVPTEIGLAALNGYDGPENKAIDRATQSVRVALNSQKQKLQSDLKLARDLLTEAKFSTGLVQLLRFEWKDGAYIQSEF